MKYYPIRIQIWDGDRLLEARGTLTALTMSTVNEPVKFGAGKRTYTPPHRKVMVHMVTAPWKFHRGKPVYEERI